MGKRQKIKNPPLGWRGKVRKDGARRGGAPNEAGGRGQMPGSVEDLGASMEQPEPNTGKRQSEAASIANLRANMGRAMEEMRANSLNRQGLFGEAIRAADEVISKYGPRTMPLMAKADALFRLGRQDEALAVSEQQVGGEDQIRYQHADMLYNMGRIGELARFCDEWEARSDTDDPYLWVNRGRLLLKADDTDGAASMAQKALDHGEAYDYASTLMADIEVARGNTAEALEWCEEADVGLDSTLTNDVRLTKINILRGSGDVGGARDLCARMLAKFPRHHSFLALMDEMGTE